MALLPLLVLIAGTATVAFGAATARRSPPSRETAVAVARSHGVRTAVAAIGLGLAAALYTTIGVLAGGELHTADPGFRADPIRIVQAVALGVGFLGGGVISAGARREGHVTGLTTAASIWSTAAVGIAVGLGHYVLAAGATLLQLVILHGLERFERPTP